MEAILPSLERSSERKAALQRRFGMALGKLRGHDRYLETVADETTEVLVDETWAVPLEVNVLRARMRSTSCPARTAASARGWRSISSWRT